MSSNGYNSDGLSEPEDNSFKTHIQQNRKIVPGATSVPSAGAAGKRKILTDMAQAKVIPFDIYPEITKETIKLKKVYGQQMINYKKGLSTKPAPIHPCALNPMEIHRIATLVNNPRFFQLYDHGHTTIFYKNKPNQIIADIHFTDLSRINTACKDKVNFLLAFFKIC
ncbi:hypothetical protein PSTG_13468 [Puccinia striiformis f. sp. tritici PST-78]|uniref:Uncharacterized protein n=1 Tax=Puccinia striiformis f. sp. tritici PST-78 TaxID=1165861 RepID=A0A0L0V1L6_9BASI|nr:hypothetical protein PSTG_13468 [Puccinia striiformis f. sp. tritici PST-78]